IFNRIEQRLVVRCPGDGADAVQRPGAGWIGECLSGLKVLDAERVLAKSGEVGGVGKPAPVIRDVVRSDREEGLPFCELIAIEDDLFGTLRRGLRSALATEDGVLLALLGAYVVPPIALAVRGRLVGLLDVTQHLFVEFIAERGKIGSERV